MHLEFLKYKHRMTDGLEPLGQIYVLAELVLWHTGGQVYTAEELKVLRDLTHKKIAEHITHLSSFGVDLVMSHDDTMQEVRDKIVEYTTGKVGLSYARLEWQNRLPQYVATWSHRQVGKTEYITKERHFRAVQVRRIRTAA